MKEKILKLKKENDVCILAHCYQNPEILEVADYVGDSFALAKLATTVKNKNVVMCGVKFMAETVKILSPEKTVYLSNKDAGCAMAEMMDKSYIEEVKKEYPDYTVVAYVNTTSELKTVCDVCVTSSSAIDICEKIDNDKILFIPDRNLGRFVASKIPSKEFKVLDGCCPTHASITKEDVLKCKAEHPDALFLVHPECEPEVVALADYVGSTTGIMDYAKKSDKTEFIIGTENNIATHLANEVKDKTFYTLTKSFMCKQMRVTTLQDVLDCVNGNGYEINLDEDTMRGAKKCIDEMIRLG